MRPIHLLSLLLYCSGLMAQNEFDLVVIKPNPHFVMGSYGRPQPGGRYLWTGYTVQALVIWAYDALPFQVHGGPDWVLSAHWDIEAKVDGMHGSLNHDSVRPLLQKLLESRFGLRVRKEDRPGDAYELQITPKGLRLHQGDGEHWEPKPPDRALLLPPPPPPPGFAGQPVQIPRKNNAGGGIGFYYLDGAPISRFIGFLTMRLEHPIADRTGLTGTFEGMLEFADGEAPGTSLSQAMREQWGLQIAKRKGTNPYVVIETVTKPTEN